MMTIFQCTYFSTKHSWHPKCLQGISLTRYKSGSFESSSWFCPPCPCSACPARLAQVRKNPLILYPASRSRSSLWIFFKQSRIFIPATIIWLQLSAMYWSNHYLGLFSLPESKRWWRVPTCSWLRHIRIHGRVMVLYYWVHSWARETCHRVENLTQAGALGSNGDRRVQHLPPHLS